jgi:hypothetical protein
MTIHIDDEALELHTLERLPETTAAPVEEHVSYAKSARLGSRTGMCTWPFCIGDS